MELQLQDRIDRLQGLDDQTDWNQLFADLARLEDERSEAARSEDGVSFYVREVLPLVGSVYRTLLRADYPRLVRDPDVPDRDFDLAISLLGFSYEPVCLFLTSVRTPYIAILATTETGELAEKLAVLLLEAYERGHTVWSEPPSIHWTAVAGSDPAETFQAVRKQVEDTAAREIAIDVSGSKKPMVAGSFTSGMVLPGASIFYTDFEVFDPRKRKPMTGSEYLRQLPDPFEIFQISQFDSACSLFDRGDYRAATLQLERIDQALRSPGVAGYFTRDTESKVAIVLGWSRFLEAWLGLDVSRLASLPLPPDLARDHPARALVRLALDRRDSAQFTQELFLADENHLRGLLLTRITAAAVQLRANERNGAFLTLVNALELCWRYFLRQKILLREVKVGQGFDTSVVPSCSLSDLERLLEGRESRVQHGRQQLNLVPKGSLIDGSRLNLTVLRRLRNDIVHAISQASTEDVEELQRRVREEAASSLTSLGSETNVLGLLRDCKPPRSEDILRAV